MTTYTSTLRLREPAVGGDDGSWGTYLNDDLIGIDAGVNGILSKSINGLTTYTMTADGSSTEEARYAAYSFTGTLSSTCTVTMPANSKIVLVQNATIGGFNVVLTVGVGGTVTIPADSRWYRVVALSTGISAFNAGVSGTLRVVGATTLNGALAVTGATTVPNGTTGTQAVNYSQFPQTTNSVSSYVGFPGLIGSGVGLYVQSGAVVTSGSGQGVVTFPKVFPTACVGMVGTAVNSSTAYNVMLAAVPNTTGQTFVVRDLSGTATNGITVYWMAMGY